MVYNFTLEICVIQMQQDQWIYLKGKLYLTSYKPTPEVNYSKTQPINQQTEVTYWLILLSIRIIPLFGWTVITIIKEKWFRFIWIESVLNVASSRESNL